MIGGTISLTIPKLKNMEEGLVSPHWPVTTRITPSFPICNVSLFPSAWPVITTPSPLCQVGPIQNVSLSLFRYFSSLKAAQRSRKELNPLLNNAPASFEGLLMKFTRKGKYAYTCTRNNNFTNRSQKGTLIVNWICDRAEAKKKSY